VRAKKLPPVLRMSRSFTRAEALSDIATAYYASTKIVEMLANTHGRGKMAEMLRLWGEGRRTPEVFRQALGDGAEAVDRKFQSRLEQSLARYEKQFVPLSRARSEEALESLSRAAPNDSALLVELALSRIRGEDAEGARAALRRVLSLEPKHPQARFLEARLALALGETKRSSALLLSMLKDGIEGFAIHMALGEIARGRGDTLSARAAFEQAHRLDPTQADPLIALADIAAAKKDPKEELARLTALAPLSAHSPVVHRRLLQLLLEEKRYADAVRAGEAALWSDINGLWTHMAFAEALAETGDLVRARFELESAVLCPEAPAAVAEAHARLAELLLRLGKPLDARRAQDAARKLDSTNERLKRQENR
jgi:tetratricopeptide (TPR) repeat protein